MRIILDKFFPRDVTNLILSYNCHHKEEWTRYLMKECLLQMSHIQKWPVPKKEFTLEYIMARFHDCVLIEFKLKTLVYPLIQTIEIKNPLIRNEATRIEHVEDLFQEILSVPHNYISRLHNRSLLIMYNILRKFNNLRDFKPLRITCDVHLNGLTTDYAEFCTNAELNACTTDLTYFQKNLLAFRPY